jgi:creatinine amidohydrolase/Fe(II)-dependent formamide hydrolase-like protein
LEDLTWAEVRDLVKAGTTTAIIGTAGTEQKGPHMVDGEHKFVMEYAADRVARALGKTLVAPVITYVPEGSWENPGGHMGKPGTITLPDDRFVELLVNAGRSLKAGGFTTILFLGESGGNVNGMRQAVERLNEHWKGAAKAFWIGDYYTKSHDDQEKYLAEKHGMTGIGSHANILDTSEMLAVNPAHVRKNKMAPGGGYQGSGVTGDPSKSTAELGHIFIKIKVDNAVAQIKGLMAGTIQPVPLPPPGEGRGGGRGGNRAGGAATGQPATPPAPRPPTMDTAPASATPTNPPDTVFIDELTWEETRDLMKAGKTTVIIPTGGTEKNGYHMVLGKHNYTVTFAANQMARQMKNALVAPTIQYVPEGNNPDNVGPGTLSHPSPGYDGLLDAAARSLKAHGFKEILFIGDSGGNQGGMTATATKLNEEWKDLGVRVYALTDYYNQGRADYRDWITKTFNYDTASIGTHAGISDTAQLMYVRPSGVRKDRVLPWGGPQDSGVSGDPSKATVEIGKAGIQFKIDGALRQLNTLKNAGKN